MTWDDLGKEPCNRPRGTAGGEPLFGLPDHSGAGRERLDFMAGPDDNPPAILPKRRSLNQPQTSSKNENGKLRPDVEDKTGAPVLDPRSRDPLGMHDDYGVADRSTIDRRGGHNQISQGDTVTDRRGKARQSHTLPAANAPRISETPAAALDAIALVNSLRQRITGSQSTGRKAPDPIVVPPATEAEIDRAAELAELAAERDQKADAVGEVMAMRLDEALAHIENNALDANAEHHKRHRAYRVSTIIDKVAQYVRRPKQGGGAQVSPTPVIGDQSDLWNSWRSDGE